MATCRISATEVINTKHPHIPSYGTVFLLILKFRSMFGLEFYGHVNIVKVMSGRSVNLLRLKFRS